MVRTKKLTNEEYNGHPFDLQEVIKKQVLKDEAKWYNRQEIPIPKVVEPPKVKFSAGMYNLIRQILV